MQYSLSFIIYVCGFLPLHPGSTVTRINYYIRVLRKFILVHLIKFYSRFMIIAPNIILFIINIL